MDTTSCPECGLIAEVEWRAVMESTDGPIEHAKIRCVQKHWFLLPVAALRAPRARPRVTQPAPASRHP
jgi:hypothetical protein